MVATPSHPPRWHPVGWLSHLRPVEVTKGATELLGASAKSRNCARRASSRTKSRARAKAARDAPVLHYATSWDLLLFLPPSAASSPQVRDRLVNHLESLLWRSPHMGQVPTSTAGRAEPVTSVHDVDSDLDSDDSHDSAAQGIIDLDRHTTALRCETNNFNREWEVAYHRRAILALCASTPTVRAHAIATIPDVLADSDDPELAAPVPQTPASLTGGRHA